MKNFGVFAGIQAGVVLAGFLMLRAMTFAHPEAFALGGIVVLINVILLWALAWLGLVKKAVALAVMLIVFKYAFLGLSIYYLVVQRKVDSLGFGFGVTSVVASSLIFAVYYALTEKKFGT